MKHFVTYLSILFFVFTATCYGQAEKTKLLKAKATELTDYIYSTTENLREEDRHFIEEASYDYLNDLVKLMEKDMDRSSSKFQSQLNYLNTSLAKEVALSMNTLIGNRRRGASNVGKTDVKTQRFRKKVVEIMDDLDVEIPKWKNGKKKK